MSTVPESATPPTPPGAVPVYNVPAPLAEGTKKIDYIVVYGHSNLFYWWPVWVVAFALAVWTYLDGQQMAVVPPDSVVVHGEPVDSLGGERRDVLIAPAGKGFSLASVATTDADGTAVQNSKGKTAPASMTVSGSNNLGVIFALTLFVVALVSTLTLRGLVSLVVIIFLIAVVLLLALMNWWDDVFRFLGGLDIRMNAAGYLFIAVPLFVAWLFVVLVYDRQQYMIFDEGQIRFVREVGESEIVMASEGAIVEKKRDDVFRHWLLGFGSGDLQIRVNRGGNQTIELENVLLISRKLTVVNHMLQHKAIATEG